MLLMKENNNIHHVSIVSKINGCDKKGTIPQVTIGIMSGNGIGIMSGGGLK